MNLDSKILDFHLSEQQKKALKKLGIENVRDLLYHFPTRYGDTATTNFVANLEVGSQATLFGKVKNLKTGKTFNRKMSQATGTFYDDTGEIKVTWFNQPYLAKMLSEDKLVKIIGKISEYNQKLGINNPKVEEVSEIPIGVGNSLFGEGGEKYTLYPVYPESKGLTSNWIYHNIQKIFKNDFFNKIEDPIPKELLEKYNLPKLTTALIWIHNPHKESDALAARKRFAFEEIFYIQLQRQFVRKQRNQKKSFKIKIENKQIEDFIKRYPFQLTDSQNKAIKNILDDFQSDKPMARLMEGDVGSGKTAVAAATVFAITTNKLLEMKDSNLSDQDRKGHLQTAYMVPTEILAKQHFQNFIQFFENINIKIGLMTSSGCYKFPSKINPKEATKISRAQLLKWVADGEIPILIGTHSLIQKSVKFQNLAYVIIDEQHRFGTFQRQKLATKDNFEPHLLSMTATPIPRTLALTIFGDLDLTLIDQMPMGRKPVITKLVLPNEREKIYEKLKKEMEEGRQVYVICPRIEEPDEEKQNALIVKSVKAEAKRLKTKIFPEKEIAILHSKMKPAEKDQVMKEFEEGKIDILVSTSVVEVGVNVPNATSIVIEGAERFGLAQLHQLRGRVLRSTHQAYAYLFSDTKSTTSIERLKALKTAKNGFELSELDLKFRGTGDLYGKKQWGISDLGMEAIKNIKMVEAARNSATEIIEKKLLKNYPNLQSVIEGKVEVHFE